MITRRQLLQFSAATAAAAAVKQATRAEAQTADAPLFPGFKTAKIKTSGATLNLVSGGKGSPVLLMHGYPQTHVLWHKIAPKLAEKFAVVAADLRGYGDSSKPEGGEKHENYSKRAMALDMVEAMHQLGFEKFAVVGHDRGGRVAHRLALDHANVIATWQARAAMKVTGKALPGRHFLPEEAPEQTLAALQAFLNA